ncbi:hypothetical protein LCGC14_2767340, partial [marine sediment metagenome]
MASNLNLVTLYRSMTGSLDYKLQSDAPGGSTTTFLTETINQSFDNITVINHSAATDLRFCIVSATASITMSAKGDGITTVSPGVSIS